MSARTRVLIVCPGRGAYGREALGQLKGRSAAANEVVATCDALRSERGQPTISELDAAEQFRSRLHLAGEHASLLTFACSLADLADLDAERYEVVGVTGNSLGFYTALAASGALPLASGARLVETLGAFQRDNVIGGQLLYPLWDGDWLESRKLQDDITRALAAAEAEGVRAEWSIRLGGTAVLGADDAGLRALEANLPPIERAGRSFPLRLLLHSAFHTSLMQETSERAFAELSDLPFRPPAVPLIDGEGRVHRPRWADPAHLRDYTLGAQVTTPYDFTKALRTALAHCAPDLVVCLGPGNAMGGPVAQLLADAGWRGAKGKAAFIASQTQTPTLAAFGVPEQAASLRARA